MHWTLMLALVGAPSVADDFETDSEDIFVEIQPTPMEETHLIRKIKHPVPLITPADDPEDMEDIESSKDKKE